MTYGTFRDVLSHLFRSCSQNVLIKACLDGGTTVRFCTCKPRVGSLINFPKVKTYITNEVISLPLWLCPEVLKCLSDLPCIQYSLAEWAQIWKTELENLVQQNISYNKQGCDQSSSCRKKLVYKWEPFFRIPINIITTTAHFHVIVRHSRIRKLCDQIPPLAIIIACVDAGIWGVKPYGFVGINLSDKHTFSVFRETWTAMWTRQYLRATTSRNKIVNTPIRSQYFYYSGHAKFYLRIFCLEQWLPTTSSPRSLRCEW